MPDFQYMNTQQKINHYEGIVGPCRDLFMNDEMYLNKLVGLAAKKTKENNEVSPEEKPEKKPFFGFGGRSETKDTKDTTTPEST